MSAVVMPGAEPADRTVPKAVLVLILGALGAIAPLSIDMYLPALPTLGRSLVLAPRTSSLP
jgi:MFS transporter, DHA1 family, multidrug resistance protein